VTPATQRSTPALSRGDRSQGLITLSLSPPASAFKHAGGAQFYLRNNNGGDLFAGRSESALSANGEVYMGARDGCGLLVPTVFLAGDQQWMWSGASGGNGDVGQLIYVSFRACMDDTVGGVLLAACTGSAEQVCFTAIHEGPWRL
jgi:hypothetical protein